MALIFLSYSSKDKTKAQYIFDAIKKAGYEQIFIDHDKNSGLIAGKEWEQQLYKELKRAYIFIPIISTNWIQSKWCFAEYTQARALGKDILPIVIENSEDKELQKFTQGHIHTIDTIIYKDAIDRLITQINTIALKTQGGFSWDSKKSPYPGLFSYEIEDAAIFFSREKETKELIEELNSMLTRTYPKLLNIVAASGMGKSSLLKAGVIAKLKLTYKSKWHILPTLRPQQNPLNEFAKILATSIDKKDSYKDILTKLNSKNYQQTIDDILDTIELKESKKAILLPIDQAEEFFTVSDSKSKKQLFKIFNYLFTKENFFIIQTLRADYLKDFQKDKDSFSIQKSQKIYNLLPMQKENLALVIKEPAKIASIILEESLVEKLKNDTKDTQALPLLALTLLKLYNKFAKNGSIKLNDYLSLAKNSTKPLESIISTIAEEAIEPFKNNPKAINALKRAFIPHLVTLKENSNSIVKKSATIDIISQDAKEPIEALVKARLLIKKTKNSTTYIEIAHEALIDGWQRLKEWIEDEKELISTQKKVEIAYIDWLDNKNQNKALLSGLLLEKALYYKNRLPKEQEYITKSQDYQLKKDRIKKSIYTISFILIALFAIFSFYQYTKAKEQTKIAKEQAQIAIDAKKEAQKNEKRAIASEKALKKQKLNLEKKNKTLNLLTNATIETIINTNDDKIVDKYIKKLLQKKETKEAFIAILKPLIKTTESMDDDERQYWFDTMTSMTNNQLSRLAKILLTEKYKLTVLEKKYYTKTRNSNKKHLLKLIISSLDECKKNKEKKCLISSEYIINDLNIFNTLYKEGLNSLNKYKKIVKNPTNKFYILRAKYYTKLKKPNKAINAYKEAFNLDNNITHITNIVKIYKDINKTLEAKKFLTSVKLPQNVTANELNYFIYTISNTDKNYTINKVYPYYKNYINNLYHKSLKYFIYIKKTLAYTYESLNKNREALNLYRDILLKYNKSKHQQNIDKSFVGSLYGNLSWYLLLNKQYKSAIKNAQQGLALSPDKLWVKTNLAHGYMFIGDLNKSIEIHKTNMGKLLNKKQIWQEMILKDFECFKKNKIKSKYYQKVIDLFNKEKKTITISNGFEVFEIDLKLYNKYNKLIKLIISSKSINIDEKYYWINKLPKMSSKQISYLKWIFKKENIKLNRLIKKIINL